MNIVMMTIAYALLRLFSFYFQPTTPLNQNPHFLNTSLAILITATAAYLLYKKNILGWYIVAGEIILCGSGTFLQAFGVSLRSLLLITSLPIYFFQNYRAVFKPGKTLLITTELLIIATLGFIRGWYFSNPHANIIADTIPYLFLLYYFPLLDLLRDQRWRSFCFSAILAAIFGQAIFIIFTYIGLTGGYFHAQDAFYHWYRDVAGGKITLISYNFYRLVLNEQLLLIPVLLIFIFRKIAGKIKNEILAITASLFLLSLNLTRIYIIALIVGLLALFNRKNWRRWLTMSLGSMLIFFVMFSTLFLISSGGKSFGLEVFGLRLQSIVAPNLEDSSLSRVLLLPKIFEQILQHPFLGRGLGSTVTVFSPITKTDITTPNYDWGYLELLVELGVIGLGIWLLFLYTIARKQKNLPRWQIASFVSLLIINLTSPAVFHVFGLTWLGLLLALGVNASAKSPDESPHTPAPLSSSTANGKKNSAAIG